MTRADLIAFLRAQKWAVVASVGASGGPQGAVVGVAVTDDLELVFDTLGSTRKAANLVRDPRIAVVMGWDDAQTAQLEGVADQPAGVELERLQRAYFARFPDGPTRLAWPGITYFRVRPTWARHSDFRGAEPAIVEFGAAELRGGTAKDAPT